ncbi:MAG: outer membrane lipoprotein carrier protein LolA [Sedimentisphaerales bacterium]|nr:outer membrane lipoprotein carrier protein LolA [Sedimentisphaerales bacterium]
MDCTVAIILAGLILAAPAQPRPQSVEEVIGLVQTAGKALNTYQARLEYILEQPLLDSRTVRTGVIYYMRSAGTSRLRVSFQTLKQDDQQAQPCVEEFLFDGVWLTHIDYQVKSVTKRQMTEPNRPRDAFDLASQEFPVIGFSDVNELLAGFESRLIHIDANDQAIRSCQLEFVAKPGSRYAQRYRKIVFTIDAGTWLPSHVHAISAEGDIYLVNFTQAKVNASLNPSLFDVRPPAQFGPPQVIPLERHRKE